MKKFFKDILMTAFVVIIALLTFISPEIKASPINIDWVGGSSGPRNDSWESDSWDNYRDNLITAVKNNLKFYDTQPTVIELTSNISDGSTIIELMDSKVSSGDFSYSGQQFDFGFFIETVNGADHDPANDIYWQVLVNGQKIDSGVSDETINNGDVVSFSLDSSSNDKVIIKEDLGEYYGVLGTEINAYWEGNFLDINNVYPIEKGHAWYEVLWITSNLDSTFVPEDVSMTVYIERYDYYSSFDWVNQKTISVSPSDKNVIIQSFQNGDDSMPGTQDDVEVSDNALETGSLIFSSNGINFLPPPPPITTQFNEPSKLAQTRDNLLDGKHRFRFVVEVPFKYSNGEEGLATDERIVYKEPKELNQSSVSNIFSIIVNLNSEDENLFDIEFSFDSIDENNLIKIEHSSDLENWSEFDWKYGTGILNQGVEGKKNFFRGIVY